MTRQTARNRHLRQQGLCTRCRLPSKTFRCAGCRAIKRQQERQRFGYEPWRPGGPGQPPIEITTNFHQAIHTA